MKKNWWTEEGKAVTKYKDLAQFVQKINKTVEGPENQSHKLSAQGWIIKQTRNISPPPLEFISNLAILCDLYIFYVTTDTEKR